MSETTNATSTTAPVDEGARFRAFTALALAVTALTGGGVVANALQWLLMDRLASGPSDGNYLIAVGGAPLLLSVAALYLASTSMSSVDPLARPVARTSLVLSGVAILGAAVLMMSVGSLS